MAHKTECTPRSEVLKGELNDALFAANFGRLIRDEAQAVYCEPGLFFRNTFPKDALRSLCRRVFAPLPHPAEAGRFFRLSTGFGGGKTHALMAVWYPSEKVPVSSMGAHLLASDRYGSCCRRRCRGCRYPILGDRGGPEACSLAVEFAFRRNGVSVLTALGGCPRYV